MAEHGMITCEDFDLGCSRRVPWVRRPRAAALLEQAQGTNRGFDAVVVGEFERAFTDRQFHEVAALPCTGWLCGCPRRVDRLISPTRTTGC